MLTTGIDWPVGSQVKVLKLTITAPNTGQDSNFMKSNDSLRQNKPSKINQNRTSMK